jgi:hypothetical protein
MRFAQGLAVGLVFCSGVAYTQKDRYAYRVAELSRELIGQENTARIEAGISPYRTVSTVSATRSLAGRPTRLPAMSRRS